jgi:hypothetical protein
VWARHLTSTRRLLNFCGVVIIICRAGGAGDTRRLRLLLKNMRETIPQGVRVMSVYMISRARREYLRSVGEGLRNHESNRF